MESLWQDLRFGLRALRSRPGLTLVAVLSLGLGIGANATVFTWMNTFILNPLPAVPSPGRLVHINTRAPNGDGWSVSYPALKDWREAVHSMDMVGSSFAQFGLRGEGGAVERAWGGLVSGNYFDALQVRPALGRLLAARDEAERTPVVVLGYSYWQSRFAGDSTIAGRHLTLSGADLTVIGVAAPRFGGTIIGLRWDLFVPVTLQPLLNHAPSILEERSNEWLDGTGRLRPGYSIAQARAELDAAAKRIAAATGDDDTKNGAIVKPISEEGAASFLKPVLIALLGVTGVVLLIACANVANLLLARAIARRREIGVRLALGASRARLVRQLLTESLALAAMAGLVGVVVAFWGQDLFGAFIPPSPFPVTLEMHVDGNVLLFGFAVTLVAAIAFGLVPALQASNPDLVSSLKDTIGGTPARRASLQSGLVVVQVALSLVSLVCAGLFVRSLDAVRRADFGFREPDRALLISTDLGLAGVPDSAQRALVQRLLDRVRALPGVKSASVTSGSPLGFGGNNSTTVEPEGYAPQPRENMSISYYVVGSDYFKAMAIPILKGRGFEATDVAASEPVIVVNEQFARHYWPGQDPIGRRVKRWGRTLTVIGMSAQGKYQQVTESPREFVYVSYDQNVWAGFDVVVRAAADPVALTPALRRAFQETDADLPFLDVRTMAQHMQASLTTSKLGAGMLSAFGIMALLLSAIGIYGVMSYSVSQRTREIGVRVALGAARGHVVGMVVGRAMRLVAVGLAIGLAAALGAAQLLRSQLIGVGPRDPLTFTAIALLLGAVALGASWIPARRAAKVDPMVALRYE
jgi:predicted permease